MSTQIVSKKCSTKNKPISSVNKINKSESRRSVTNNLIASNISTILSNGIYCSRISTKTNSSSNSNLNPFHLIRTMADSTYVGVGVGVGSGYLATSTSTSNNQLSKTINKKYHDCNSRVVNTRNNNHRNNGNNNEINGNNHYFFYQSHQSSQYRTNQHYRHNQHQHQQQHHSHQYSYNHPHPHPQATYYQPLNMNQYQSHPHQYHQQQQQQQYHNHNNNNKYVHNRQRYHQRHRHHNHLPNLPFALNPYDPLIINTNNQPKRTTIFQLNNPYLLHNTCNNNNKLNNYDITSLINDNNSPPQTSQTSQTSITSSSSKTSDTLTPELKTYKYGLDSTSSNSDAVPDVKDDDEMDEIIQKIVSIPVEFESVINDDISELIGFKDDNNNNDRRKNINVNVNNSNESYESSKLSKYDAEFVRKRTKQIRQFLKLWDSYPETSSNIQNGEEKIDIDIDIEYKEYKMPPGLHKINKNNEGGDGDSDSKCNRYEGPSYKFTGSFSEAKSIGIRSNKWIMINIQCDDDSFSIQYAQSLIWNNSKFEYLISANFLFIHCFKFEKNTNHFIKFYNINKIPSIVIIDPHNNIKRFQYDPPSTSQNINNLRQNILKLLDSYPTPHQYNIKYNINIIKDKPTRPPIPHNINKNKRKLCFTDSLCISSTPHIYCKYSESDANSINIWDIHYPYKSLKCYAYILSTRQTFNWNDWMLIMSSCSKIIGCIPSEQHIEFLRNRNGEMTLESSGTYNGWWSEKRIAEYVVNEKYGLSFEGGFTSENGKERKKLLNSLELPRRPTFKKMLVIIPDLNNNDKILFHDNSLSCISYNEYDKMDNIKSFNLWLSFISYLSVNMLKYSHQNLNIDNINNNNNYNCTNFCIRLGSKWKLPLRTLYNDIEPLIKHEKYKNILFSFPKIATDATTHNKGNKSKSKSKSKNSNKTTSSSASLSSLSLSSSTSTSTSTSTTSSSSSSSSLSSSSSSQHGFEISFLSSNNKNKSKNCWKYDNKRTLFIKSYSDLRLALSTTKDSETIDFPYPLFSSGWFSFNTLSLFATILSSHLNGTWVPMFSGYTNKRKQFKQIFNVQSHTRRRPIIYNKLLQQNICESNLRTKYSVFKKQLNPKNYQRLISFWKENQLQWTDLVIDSLKNKDDNKDDNNNNNTKDVDNTTHTNHNKRNYRKKTKNKTRNRRKRNRKGKGNEDNNNS